VKVSLVLTTINVPKVLALYRKCDPAVKFIVACDRKTPKDAYEFVMSLNNTSVCMPESGHKWKCSEAIGFDCLQRRNIGFLEALKAGADAIVTIDDDNAPIDKNYFQHYRAAFALPFDGIKASGKDGWFDPGQFLVPPVVQRGFPIHVKHRPKFEPVIDAKVGAASGLILGDSDMDAYTRIGKAPTVGGVAMLAQVGCVVDPNTYTIFNSQNSCLLREFVPAYFMMPGIGRYDDVFAALIVQRVMRERGYHVHLGQPLVLQERNEHDLLVDLRAEVEGMAHVKHLAELLDHIPLPARSVIEDTRIIYEQLCHCDFIPTKSAEAGLLWLQDCEGVI
jgi:hypothetical protein